MSPSLKLPVAHYRERLAQVNPALNAAVEILPPAGGQFAFTVKDSIEIAGHQCTAGTWGYRDRPPATEDAALVAKLRAMGGVPIARTNCPDLLFAFETDNLIYGRTNNPYDLTRTCGGSSGGEAALIAAGGSPLGLGSDCPGRGPPPAPFFGIAALQPASREPPPGGPLAPPR